MKSATRVKSIVHIIFILLLCVFKSVAQDTAKIKLLFDSLSLAKQDSIKARLLNTICWQYHNTNPDTAMHFAKQALALAEKNNDKKNIAVSKYYMGRLYYTLSNDSAALKNFDEVLIIDSELNNQNDMAIVHMFKGYTYNHMNRDADMLKEFLISLDIAEKTGDKRRMSDALYSLGDYYLHNELPDSTNGIKAKPFFLQALKIDKQLDLKSNIATDYQYLGVCDTYLGNMDESEKNLKVALQMFKELNDDFHMATAYSYLGNLYNQLNRSDESLENYIKSLNIMEALGAKLEAADNADNIAAGYLKKKDYNNAIKYAQHGIALAKEVNAERQLVYLYRTLAKAAAAQKDFQNAYLYSSNASALEDSVLKREERDKLTELQTKYETEKKEKENQLLKAQNLTTQVQLQNNRILLIAAVIGLIMLAIFLYLVYRNRQTKIKNIVTLNLLNAQLQEQKEAIGRYNTLLELKALHAQMNPHFIFNCMSSIQECMLTGRLDEANIYLSKLSRLLRMVLVHSDEENITLEKELEVLQLYLELESVRLKGGFTYSIEVDEDLYTEEIQVPALILQPFAENAIWHGLLNKESDRKLEIEISQKNELLYCVVKDNGIGRQQASLIKSKHKQHISKGMQLIEKRLQILNKQAKEEKAALHINDLFTTSNEPAGTSVEIILPLITE